MLNGAAACAERLDRPHIMHMDEPCLLFAAWTAFQEVNGASRLESGQSWVGEMVIRSHDVYWPTPVFEESTQPLPPARARARRPVDA